MEEPEFNQSTTDKEQTQSTETGPRNLCRGEVVIGLTDPRAMSLEEFKNSPQLLYHGALFHFQIDRDWTSYYVSEDSSLISGSGFYTTPSRTEAEYYSTIRKTPLGTEFQKGVVPVVLEVMPHQTRMYDFTTGGDSEKLGVVSDVFFQEFMDFLRNTPDSYQSSNNGQEGSKIDISIPDWLQELNKLFPSWKRKYLANIFENISKGMIENIPPKITINELRHDDYRNSVAEPETGLDVLDEIEIERDRHKNHIVDNEGRYRTKDGKYIVEFRSSKHGGELLRLFLQSKGYDGLISCVRGDDPKIQKPHLEYVFFPGSFHKIGTYDQWQQEEDLVTPGAMTQF